MSPPPTSSAQETSQGLRPESALRQLLSAREGLARLLAEPGYAGAAFPTRITELVRLLMQAGERDPNVLIASILLCQSDEYPVRQAVNVAVVADHLLHKLGRDAAQRSSVVGAALTMNIGMHALQEKLNRQPGALTLEQRQAMQTHPLTGRDMLRKLGISDPLWLDCVAQHHEMYDGSGYPAKLKADAIHFEARLIGMADRYCAMQSRSAWRNESTADSALLSSLGGPTGSPDAKLGRLFIETLGIYPAGSTVQLINGEIGIVKQQGDNEACPLVVSLYNAVRTPLEPPRQRDTRSENHCIVSVLNQRELTENPSLSTIWGDEARI